jgi:hypothetical protein
MSDWKHISETAEAYWFENSNGEIVADPKS